MEGIKQKLYGDLTFDNSEKDIVAIWMEETEDSQVIQIERANLQKLIDQLIKFL